MFRTAHTLSCILVSSAIALFVTPGVSQAQRGGHGGGGHFGGAHVGGYHGAVHVGGYHPGAYHSPAFNRGYRYPYARYGYSPYYGWYSPYFYDVPTYDSAYSPLYYGDAPYSTPSSDTYQAFYPPATLTIPSDTSAHISVTVPPAAELWFDGTATTTTGTVREFNSPPLTPGKYGYEIRARWNENGREMTQTQRVEVTPGTHVDVRFPVPSGALGQPVNKD